MVILRSPVLTPPRLLAPRLYPPGMRDDYLWRVLSVRPGNLIGLWGLDELSGSVAHDMSGRRHNGVIVGADPGKQGIGDGRTCMWLDGSTDYINIYSTALAAAFNGREGSLMAWAKVNSAGVWIDGTQRRVAYLRADASNYVTIFRSTTNGQMNWQYVAAGVSQLPGRLGLSLTTWMQLVVTWSKTADAVRGYLNGVQQDATFTGLGVWVGALAAGVCCIGAQTTAPAQVWHGWLGPHAIWTYALPHEEIEYLGPRALGLAA